MNAPACRRIMDIPRRRADAYTGPAGAPTPAIVERLNQTKLATLDRRHCGLLRARHVGALRLVAE